MPNVKGVRAASGQCQQSFRAKYKV